VCCTRARHARHGVTVVLLCADRAPSAARGYIGHPDSILMRVTDVFLPFRAWCWRCLRRAIKPGITSAIFAIALTGGRLTPAGAGRNLDIRSRFVARTADRRVIGAHRAAPSRRCASQLIVRITLHELHHLTAARWVSRMGAQPPSPEWADDRDRGGASSWSSVGADIPHFIFVGRRLQPAGRRVRDVLDPKQRDAVEIEN